MSPTAARWLEMVVVVVGETAATEPRAIEIAVGALSATTVAAVVAAVEKKAGGKVHVH